MCTYGRKIESMRGSGLIIKCMEKERYSGMTEENIRAIIKMTKSMDSGYSSGLMAGNTLEIGRMASSMAGANISLRRVRKKSESGSTVSVFGGSTTLLQLHDCNFSNFL